MKYILVLILCLQILNAFQNKEYIIQQDNSFEIRNKEIMGKYKTLEEIKEAYLKEFKKKGLHQEYFNLKNFDIVDKRYYPTPNVDTWVKKY